MPSSEAFHFDFSRDSWESVAPVLARSERQKPCRTEDDVYAFVLHQSAALQDASTPEPSSLLRFHLPTSDSVSRPRNTGMQTIKETVNKYWTAATWDKRSMRDLQGWTIVVIGATDGVGYESAKAFAEHNAHVVLVGRNEEKSKKYFLFMRTCVPLVQASC